MTLKEQLKEKKDALVALKDAIEAEEPEAIEQAGELADAIAEIEKSIEAAENAKAMLEAVGNEEPESEDDEMKGIEELTKKAAEINKNEKGWSVSTHLKAATDTVTAPQIADVDRTVAPQPKRVAAADFFSNAQISGNAITYFIQGAYEGSPAVTAQGAKKPQNSTSFTPTTLPLSKIAAYMKETDEILWDADFLATEVENSLVYRVGVIEDNTVVSAIAGTSGVLTRSVGTGTNALADAIIGGVMDIKSASAYDASVVILNPADYLTLLQAKDANNQYYGGGYFAGAYGNGQFGAPTAIWGVPVLTSSAVTAGEAIVAAREAVKVWKKGGIDVKIYEQNEDDAIYNRVTLVGEERMAVAVVDLNGVCLIS